MDTRFCLSGSTFGDKSVREIQLDLLATLLIRISQSSFGRVLDGQGLHNSQGTRTSCIHTRAKWAATLHAHKCEAEACS